MLKHIKCCIFTVLIAISVLSFSSCGGISSILGSSGKVTEVELRPGNQAIVVSWKIQNRYRSSIRIDFWETESPGNGAYFSISEEGDLSCFTIKDLKADTNYTVKVSVIGSDKKCISNMENSVATITNVSEQSYYKKYEWKDENSSSVIKVPKDKSIIELTGVNGKNITFANYNKKPAGEDDSTNVIKAEKLRHYAAAYSNSYYIPSASVRAAAGESLGEPVIDFPFGRHFTPPAEKNVKLFYASEKAATSAKDTFDYNRPTPGQTKTIWVDKDVNISQFQQEQMTLYAIGYEPNTESSSSNKIKCFVWANSANVSNDGDAGKVSLEMIVDITERFVKFYKLEEKVFGDTFNYIFTNDGNVTMDNYSTKDAVNIVLTDIGKDGTSGKCGVGGYFWAKDYYSTKHADAAKYKVLAASNEGKYFYIDIPYCNYNGEDYSGNNGKVSDFSISTLFHEYQHMINFKNKMNAEASADNSGDSWYNEMLSMLCEDLLQDAMNMTGSVQKTRLPYFNAYYYMSGTAQYLNNNSGFSYSTAYAFGSWLARNYGGSSLVSEISQNNKVGTASIVDAVNKINSSNVTWDQLMEKYLTAVAIKADYAKDYNLPTHNVSSTGESASITIKGYRFNAAFSLEPDSSGALPGMTQTFPGTGPIEAKLTPNLDLWSKDYSVKFTDSDQTYYGPYHLWSTYDIDVQPTGFVLHTCYDKVETDSVTLYFTDGSDDNQELYIFIQNPYEFSK